jgi:transposase
MGKVAKVKQQRIHHQWKDEYYVRIFQLAKQGLSNQAIWECFGLHQGTWERWLERYPAIKDALDQARGKSKDGTFESFREYIAGRLPEELKEIWKEVMSTMDDEGSSTIDKVEAMLKDAGKRARQHLFVHALFHYNFNISKACRACNTSRTRFNRWVMEEPEFGEMLNEMHQVKKDFFDEALVKLVKSGDRNAIIFANKTVNADRYAAPPVTKRIEGKVDHKHAHVHGAVDLEELDIPLETKKLMLKALRKRLPPRQVETLEE